MLAAAGTTPAHATLQIAANIGGDEFFCADNTSCDANPVAGVINTNPVILDGISFTSTSAAAASGSVDFLNSSSLLITNTNSVPVKIVITVSQTNFTAPVNKFSDADSGVWQGSAASTALLKWFIDPANAQGAVDSTSTPGVLVDTSASTAAFPVLGFSRTDSAILDSLASPYSMTEQATIVLGAGESLVNRGQSIIGTEAPVPEPSTWVMFGIGLAALAFGSRRKRNERLASFA
jgi:PEP-CTERM motif